MEYRSLGKSGLKVSVLGFGNMTSGWEGDTEAWSYQCIDKCFRAGVNFIDTAEFYGMGKAETVLGANLKQGGWDRDDIIISTKLNPAPMCCGMQGNSMKRMRAGMNRCLERLQMDNADVIFLHRFDHEVPLLEQIRTMNQFIEDEKAYYWGTSEFTPQQLMECHQLCERYGFAPSCRVVVGTGDNPMRNVHGPVYRGVYDFADPDSSVFMRSLCVTGNGCQAGWSYLDWLAYYRSPYELEQITALTEEIRAALASGDIDTIVNRGREQRPPESGN